MKENALFDRAEALATSWTEAAKQRRAMIPNDPAADIIDYCASEMLEVLSRAAHDDEEISVADYAALHHRSPSTVRRWCSAGVIASRPNGRGYLIRRGEPAPNRNGVERDAAERDVAA